VSKEKELMKRFLTLAMVLLVGLASVQAAQTDDQQKKKKKKAQTTQTATPAPKTGGAQTSSQHVSAQTNKRHVSTQTSSNQQVTKPYSKKAHSNTANYGTQTVNKSNKSKKQTNVVTNNNVQVNKKAYRHYKRTGNEWSYNVARTRYVRERHDRNWWNHHYNRITFYGGGYWYWNAGWWYPAWGYNPYYNSYVYDGPIFGYGYASPGDVTAEVQRALAARRYYYGPIDGILGPGTRSAIQQYQIDRGLAVTAAIDEPTLATLGMT
jgi:Putative peptidoglycan binding domain